MSSLPRRQFLQQAGLAVVPLLGGGRLLAEQPVAIGSRIVQSRQPLNLEFPFGKLASFRTPTELFYVRNHYPIPKLDPRSYRLEVVGAVKRPLTLTLDDLQKIKSRTLSVTMECAGNGRSLLHPPVKGVQWGTGGVSTGDYTGISLAAVLDLAGVQPGAVEVILDGADKGDPKKEIQPPYDITFCRSLSLTKAQKPETMLAWGMNGKDLLPEHGFPLRAIVPGWYGMASVKWLTRIIVTRTPFNGFDQTIDYGIWAKGEDGLPRLTPVTEMQVKSTIAGPVEGASVPAGKPVRIHGAAWAGEAEVERLEVSTDGGRTWALAKWIDASLPFCWRRWEYSWTPSTAGRQTLKARATDRLGRTQPEKHDPARRSYMINFIAPVSVTVTA
ncbi:MAG: sulfite oxidase [Gemmataceae bacterium]